MQLEFMRLAEERKNPSEQYQSLFPESERISKSFCLLVDLVDFSDEEGYGKYLDLHRLYVRFVNIKGMEVNERESVKNFSLHFHVTENGLFEISERVRATLRHQ